MCEGIKHLGIMLNTDKNNNNESRIDDSTSTVALLVIPTDEERQIAVYVQQILKPKNNTKESL
jgi:acetate kinase